MKVKHTKTFIGCFFMLLLAVSPAGAAEFSVTVKNLTNGTYFTPLLITAHRADTRLFETGAPASSALRAMAEGGEISGLLSMVGGVDADTVADPAGGLLGPGDMVSGLFFDTDRTRNRFLSLVAMLLPTNDGFVGLDSLRIPYFPGTYKYYLLGYDAGTEINDERITGGGAPGQPGIPAAPGGDGGSNGTGMAATESNSLVHVHRGVIGDDDSQGGKSDLDRTIHRWLNPVAEVIVEVHGRRYGGR